MANNLKVSKLENLDKLLKHEMDYIPGRIQDLFNYVTIPVEERDKFQERLDFLRAELVELVKLLDSLKENFNEDVFIDLKASFKLLYESGLDLENEIIEFI
jgi:hypothetical protein